MKTLIVDDEPIARKILREELELLEGVEIVGEASNGHEALERIQVLEPDMVLLDLQMPLMGGFEVVQKLKGGRLPAIVIVTAFDQHAVQAFEAGAIDYLLKPVHEGRLRTAVERARAMLGRPRELAESIVRIADSAQPPSPPIRKVVGRSGDEYFLLDLDEVLAFQAEGEIVWIMTPRARYTATHSLRTLEARLRGIQFQRVHRNALVNVNHVRKMSAMSSQRWLLTLSNGQELMVSKRQAHAVRSILHW